jgi:hypothetical protein
MSRPAAPRLDIARAERWTAAAVPWWVPRVVLVAGWVAALAVAIAFPEPCTPTDPSVCGPSISFAWAAVPLFATPVLLWWMPLGGCAAGVLYGALGIAFDPEPVSRAAFGVHGAACLLVGVWLVAAGRRQAAVAAEIAAPVMVRLPAAPLGRPPGPRRWGPRTLAAGVLVLAGTAGLLWYRHESSALDRHLAGATRLDARVVAVDADDYSIDVRLPDRADQAWIGVEETRPYPVGSTVPVLVDRRGDHPWVRPVAEPDDVTYWLSVGLGAFASAALLAGRDMAAESARRRLLGSSAPAVGMFARPVGDRRVALEPAEPGGGVLAVARVNAVPVRSARALLGGGTSSDPERRLSSPVTVIGDVRDGGWVVLAADNGVLLPTAPLRMRRAGWCMWGAHTVRGGAAPGEAAPGEAMRLKAYRFTGRKPWVAFDTRTETVSLILPGYFGGRGWPIPAGRVAVRDLTAASLPEDGAQPEPVLADELVVPYLLTTGPLTRPNLLLMFTEPQRVPPLRLGAALAPNTDLPFGYRSTRSSRGSHIDGVLLRARDPAALSRRILAAGAGRLGDPIQWLYEHRQVVTDTAEQDRLAGRRRTGRRVQVAAQILLGLATIVGGTVILNDDGPLWHLLLFLAVVAGLLGLGAAGGRLAR